jgi:hypothetical protein
VAAFGFSILLILRHFYTSKRRDYSYADGIFAVLSGVGLLPVSDARSEPLEPRFGVNFRTERSDPAKLPPRRWLYGRSYLRGAVPAAPLLHRSFSDFLAFHQRVPFNCRATR